MSNSQIDSDILWLYSTGHSVNYIVDIICPLMGIKKPICKNYVFSVISNSCKNV